MDGSRLSFNDVANCARPSHKYAIKNLFQTSVRELKRYYPDSLDAWDMRPTTYNPRNAVTAINSARLTDTPSILPAAFYDCCQLDGTSLTGWVCAGTAVDRLSFEDLARCIDGKQALCVRWPDFLRSIFLSSLEAEKEKWNCSTPETRCSSAGTIGCRELGHVSLDLLKSWDKCIEGYTRGSTATSRSSYICTM